MLQRPLYQVASTDSSASPLNHLDLTNSKELKQKLVKTKPEKYVSDEYGNDSYSKRYDGGKDSENYKHKPSDRSNRASFDSSIATRLENDRKNARIDRKWDDDEEEDGDDDWLSFAEEDDEFDFAERPYRKRSLRWNRSEDDEEDLEGAQAAKEGGETNKNNEEGGSQKSILSGPLLIDSNPNSGVAGGDSTSNSQNPIARKPTNNLSSGKPPNKGGGGAPPRNGKAKPGNKKKALKPTDYKVVDFQPGENGQKIDWPWIEESVKGPDFDLFSHIDENDLEGLERLQRSLLTLGLGGEVTLQVSKNGWIEDLPGDDFVVYGSVLVIGDTQPGAGSYLAQPAEVGVAEVNEEGKYQWFPCNINGLYGENSFCAGTIPTSEGGNKFDLSKLGVKKAKYIKIRDLHFTRVQDENNVTTDNVDQAKSNGFDLDAMKLIHVFKKN